MKLQWVVSVAAVGGCAALAGCTVGSDTPLLRIEPPALDVDVSLGARPPAASLRVFAIDTDVTASAKLSLDDPALGTLAGATFTPNGHRGGAATISSDGHSLAYVAMAAPEANNPAGSALRVRPWDAATAMVGPPITVATAAGILAPQFSSDGAWLIYTRLTEPTERGIVGGAVVRADGSAPPVELTTGATDQIPRWASPLGPARAGGRDPEPFAWIVFGSARAVGASPMPGTVKSLWLAAFYPARGALGRPIHLPGQSLALSALHSPYALP